MRKQLAFVKRGYLIESSYKASFILGLSSSALPVLMFFFIGKLLDGRISASLRPYGGNYFAFALVGVGLSQFLSKALKIFSNSIRRAQMSGVMEASLSTPTAPAAMVIYDATYSFLLASLHLMFVFILGSWLLGGQFSRVNVPSVLTVSLLSLVTFVAFGILSGAAIVVLKQGDPVDVVLGSGALLLSGAYVPLSAMPSWVQHVAQVLPTTHALEGLRLALFAGAPLPELKTQVIVLGLFAVLLFPTSLYAFHAAVEKGRRDGTLLHY